MKTLWEKLSDQNKGKLLLFKAQYTYSGELLINSLNVKVSFSDLTVEEAYRILQETTKKEITINNLMELFYEQ